MEGVFNLQIFDWSFCFLLTPMEALLVSFISIMHISNFSLNKDIFKKVLVVFGIGLFFNTFSLFNFVALNVIMGYVMLFSIVYISNHKRPLEEIMDSFTFIGILYSFIQAIFIIICFLTPSIINNYVLVIRTSLFIIAFVKMYQEDKIKKESKEEFFNV